MLQTEVAEIVTGDDWIRNLDLLAKLHDYSPDNAIRLNGQHAWRYR